MKQRKQAQKNQFTGEFELTVMGDGRIRLPAKVRDLLMKHEVEKLRPSIIPNEKVIALCPEQYWSRWLKKLFDEDTSHTALQKERRYHTPSSPLRWDKKGRMYIPRSLSRYAGIIAGKIAIIAGVENHFELWDEDEYIKNFEP